MSQRLFFWAPRSEKRRMSAFQTDPFGRRTRVWSMSHSTPSMSRRPPGATSKTRVPASPRPVPRCAPRAKRSVASGAMSIKPPWTLMDLLKTSVPFVTDSRWPFHLPWNHFSTSRVLPPRSRAIGSSSVKRSPWSEGDGAAKEMHHAHGTMHNARTSGRGSGGMKREGPVACLMFMGEVCWSWKGGGDSSVALSYHGTQFPVLPVRATE